MSFSPLCKSKSLVDVAASRCCGCGAEIKRGMPCLFCKSAVYAAAVPAECMLCVCKRNTVCAARYPFCGRAGAALPQKRRGKRGFFFQILPIIGRKVYIVPAVPVSDAERRNAYRQALGAAIERKYALHNVPRSAPPACAKTAAMSDCFFIIAKRQRQIKEKKLRKLFRKKATDKPSPIKGQGLSVAETYSKEKFRAVTLFFAPRGKISCRLRDPLKTSFSAARRP